MSVMDGVDATLRQIDATLAACEPTIERAKALLEPETTVDGPHQLVRLPEAPSPGVWVRFWGRLTWVLCLEWVPELRPRPPHPCAKGLDVVVDLPVVPMRGPAAPGQAPAPDFND